MSKQSGTTRMAEATEVADDSMIFTRQTLAQAEVPEGSANTQQRLWSPTRHTSYRQESHSQTCKHMLPPVTPAEHLLKVTTLMILISRHPCRK